MLNEQLQNLGFSKNQAQVYLTLFDLGQTKVGPIIQRTGFHRNIIYRALDELIARKLVHRLSKRGVFYYEPASTEQLIFELDQKKSLAEQVLLELARKRAQPTSEVFVLSGKQGVADLFNAVLAEDDDLYLIGANGAGFRDHRDEALKFDRKRVAKGIRRFHLAIETTRGSELNALPDTQVKYLPGNFSSPLVIWVFGSVVAQVLWEKPETIFLIRNKKLAEDYRKYFQLLWSNDVQTLRGADGARTFLEDTLNYKDIYWIGGNGGVEKFHPEVWREHIPKREAKQVFWHDLVDPDTHLSRLQDHGNPIGPYLEMKILPAAVASPHVICIYGNKVANIVWKKDSIINIIEDKDVAEGYLKYWKYLWGLSKKGKRDK
ncbi:MAG: hypothetical protein A3F54_00850 [Candidatus Kerfeldbacteria bacterium RIFCSPHIGHO2_12_FULL_48_17]|uniref:Transcription regulator TrmB N-terminal domain-containing protein n=1 Tax=Candidatus Kerfeldbacteria bacterium RIFCSPHIGHO2_12_FULL_48_17 TaxID=1798542 RepID=A0A1G2B4I7_9BACT|nr:MAG: hypothetical protein A3F54_00850 [Candidatus Kerfeldbacteria bacterium RIFCSPHIGHO2_12_FULL_48_17]